MIKLVVQLGVSIWADLWGGVSVHGIIYDSYYVIMNTAMMTMNTDMSAFMDLSPNKDLKNSLIRA